MAPGSFQRIVTLDLRGGPPIYGPTREGKAFQATRCSVVNDQIKDLGWKAEKTHCSVVRGGGSFATGEQLKNKKTKRQRSGFQKTAMEYREMC